ncbi:hypothetical protein [Rhodomicrobium vannielii]|uniref:hypothetical protein n=1 Tax=Rhodomicrobium vannielii TaxID=1069 RepID=UPI001124F459|nr:hypothetical protein [Rhodomicrobium vannielii]
MKLASAFRAALIGVQTLIAAGAALAAEVELRNTPFAYGDQAPDLTATCETIADWSKKAPSGDIRIDLAIEGALSEVTFDGVLAFLVMCRAPGMTVTCVTYSTNGMAAGDVVRFGGGMQIAGPDRIILDPCLASRD